MDEQQPVDDEFSALVVLATPGSPPGPGGYTVAGGPPGVPEAANQVRNWFSEKGFSVTPAVGISFSISGSRQLFDRTFGDAVPDAAAELDQAALRGRMPAELLPGVAAVVLGRPPDFGPDNP